MLHDLSFRALRNRFCHLCAVSVMSGTVLGVCINSTSGAGGWNTKNRASEAGFQLVLLHLCYSSSFLCSVSSSLPPLFVSQPTTCMTATITSMSSLCPAASSFWSLWTTKPSGLPLSSREWHALQIMSPTVLISRICLCLANSFCVVSQAQAFFSHPYN